MRRRSILERRDHPLELLIDDRSVVACNLKSLVHDLRLVIADRTRRQLDPVADDVVLISQDVQRIHCLQGFHLPLRHRKWIVTEYHSLLDFIPLVHREIYNPTELERVLLNQSQLRSNPCPDQPSKLRCSRRLVACKKHPVVRSKPHLGHQLRDAIRPEILRDPATLATLEIDVSQSRITLIPRPLVGGIKKATRSCSSPRSRNRSNH